MIILVPNQEAVVVTFSDADKKKAVQIAVVFHYVRCSGGGLWYQLTNRHKAKPQQQQQQQKSLQPPPKHSLCFPMPNLLQVNDRVIGEHLIRRRRVGEKETANFYAVALVSTL